MTALENLLQQQKLWRGAAPARFSSVISSGYARLDDELGGGWPRGGLAEICAARPGIGELQLVLPALAALTSAGKRVVWLAPPHLPYAPALAAAGVDLTNVALVRAAGRRDVLWAAEQAMRSGACHALLAWFRHASYADLRRLAVSAESGLAFAALFRPPQSIDQPSPACLRLSLEWRSGLEIRIVKRRGAPLAAPLRLPLKRPVHALDRPVPAGAPVRDAGIGRRLDLPVHA
jgi:cell division inhibitor SulA/protein ImuA